MVAYYQHNIAAWMDGTEGLSDGEYRAYHVMCELMYLNGGPIVVHERGIAARCNQHILAFRKNLVALMAHKKIIMVDGKATNKRVEKELARIGGRPRLVDANPPPTSDQPPPGTSGVGRGSSGGRASKSLKNNDPPHNPPALYNTIQESLEPKEGSNAPFPVLFDGPDLEKQLFERGKAILGRSAGGMIAKLLQAKGHNLAVARSIIEIAATKENPREYVAAATQNRNVRSNGEINGQRRGGSAIEAVERVFGRLEGDGDEGGDQDDSGRLQARRLC